MKAYLGFKTDYGIFEMFRTMVCHSFRFLERRCLIKILTVSTACGFIFVSVCRGSDQKAETLKELIRMYDPSSCKGCHEEIYSRWETSHHARSIMGIFMDRYLKSGVLSVKEPREATKKNFPCFKCHFPQIEYATDQVATEIARAILDDDKTTMGKLNISCLVCHHDKGIVHGSPESGILYGPKGEEKFPDEGHMRVKKSPIMKQSVMCGQCHGLGPNLEFEHPVQCATLYGSYLHAYIPSGGTQTCQECHMKDADHSCPPDFNQRNDVSLRLKRALLLDVSTLVYQSQFTPGEFIPTIVIKTKITSKAGHRIPDG